MQDCTIMLDTLMMGAWLLRSAHCSVSWSGSRYYIRVCWLYHWATTALVVEGLKFIVEIVLLILKLLLRLLEQVEFLLVVLEQILGLLGMTVVCFWMRRHQSWSCVDWLSIIGQVLSLLSLVMVQLVQEFYLLVRPWLPNIGGIDRSNWLWMLNWAWRL